MHRINAAPKWKMGESFSESAPGLALVRSGLRGFFTDCVNKLQAFGQNLKVDD